MISLLLNDCVLHAQFHYYVNFRAANKHGIGLIKPVLLVEKALWSSLEVSQKVSSLITVFTKKKKKKKGFSYWNQ